MYRYDANYALQVGVAPRVAAHSCAQLLIVTSGSGMVAT
jgi:hypothetical protein